MALSSGSNKKKIFSSPGSVPKNVTSVVQYKKEAIGRELVLYIFGFLVVWGQDYKHLNLSFWFDSFNDSNGKIYNLLIKISLKLANADLSHKFNISRLIFSSNK